MKREYDFVIINPGAQSHLYPGEIGPQLSALQPPYWAALIAAWVRARGYSVAIIDAETDELTPREVALKINELNPHLTCMTVLGSTPSASSTPKMTVAGETIREIMEIAKGTKTVWHGIHPSALPEKTLTEEGGDYVCRGEGFFTIVELLEILATGGTDISGVPGVCYMTTTGPLGVAKLEANAQEKLVDPNDLPIAAWDLLPVHKYKAHNWHCFGSGTAANIEKRTPYVALYTAYGCPFKCTYCNIHELYSLDGRPGVRYRDPEKIIEEIDLLVNDYGVKNFKFADELFTTKRSHVEKICDLLIERDYDLNIWTFVRAQPYDIKLLKKMRKAGFTWVAMGIESFVDAVRRGVDKNTKDDKVLKTIAMYKEANISVIANFIFGLPDDTFETMQKTLDMAIEHNFEYIDFYTCMPYPGAPLYQESIDAGLKMPDKWHGYSQLGTDCLPLPTKTLSGVEVLRFRDEAFEKYFASPKYLPMIKERFGQKSVDHIENMLKIRLKRDIFGGGDWTTYDINYEVK
jgi:radical SAM superfamily enzyme YgiQ (UPF0313 family)